AATFSALVAGLAAAAASEATPGTTIEPPTAARVRAEAVPARAMRDGTRLSADMRNPSSAACEGWPVGFGLAKLPGRTDAASPQGLLGPDGPATRRAGSSTPADPLRVDRSSGRRQDSASARIAPPRRRGLVVSQGS